MIGLHRIYILIIIIFAIFLTCGLFIKSSSYIQASLALVTVLSILIIGIYFGIKKGKIYFKSWSSLNSEERRYSFIALIVFMLVGIFALVYLIMTA